MNIGQYEILQFYVQPSRILKEVKEGVLISEKKIAPVQLLSIIKYRSSSNFSLIGELVQELWSKRLKICENMAGYYFMSNFCTGAYGLV
jgi:hypothetical protein